jgi:hypothetical protein
VIILFCATYGSAFWSSVPTGNQKHRSAGLHQHGIRHAAEIELLSGEAVDAEAGGTCSGSL